MMHPQRVVSLWEMLQEVDADGVIKAVSLLSSCTKRWGMIRHSMIAQNAPHSEIREEEVAVSRWAVEVIYRAADNLGMAGVVRSCQRLDGWLASTEPGNHREEDFLQLSDGMHQLVVAFGDEVDGRKLFVMTPRFAGHYAPAAPLFGEQVDDAFRTAAPEIDEAGKCLALGRWTAAVMHLMRALEPALLALQEAVDVDVPKEQWGGIIDQIEAKIKKMTKATHGKADEQWFSEAAIHFRLLKNAWRNYSQHLHDRYDEERAEAIFRSVRDFMRHLASRLREAS